MTDRPDVPDSAVILALSRVEFGIDTVLDALRTPDPFGVRSILTEYSAQEKPNLAEKALILAIDRLLKMKVPGHAEWPKLPLAERCDWWVDRLGGFAAVVAAVPRISGAAADRLPVKDTLGAAVQAMVIGAICREYGVEAHADRTAVIARVLTDRPITPDEVLKYDDPTAAGQDVAKQLGLGDEPEEAGVRRGIRLLWRISKLFGGLDGVFEERPRAASAPGSWGNCRASAWSAGTSTSARPSGRRRTKRRTCSPAARSGSNLSEEGLGPGTAVLG